VECAGDPERNPDGEVLFDAAHGLVGVVVLLDLVWTVGLEVQLVPQHDHVELSSHAVHNAQLGVTQVRLRVTLPVCMPEQTPGACIQLHKQFVQQLKVATLAELIGLLLTVISDVFLNFFADVKIV